MAGGAFVQPVLMLASKVKGLIYVNGRPVGETSGEAGATGAEAVVPVAPRGAVYVEHRPLVNGYLPLARRLTLSGGRVMPGSVSEEPGLAAVLWPGGVVEIELTPEPIAAAEPETRGTAADPNAVQMDDGTVRLVETLDDVVGHARLSVFEATGGDWRLTHSEILWDEGAPRWPQTSEDAALAALEAWFLGLEEEARGYLTPALAQRLPALMAELTQEGTLGAVKLRYAAPGARAAVGLVRMAHAQCAWVCALQTQAVAMGGPQGTWRISDISVESPGGY